ncbi:MAG: hypothetical protein ABSF08_13335 [Candidatus Cybelea sp.]|jgi:integrase
MRHTANELMALSGIGYDLAAERSGHGSTRTTFEHYKNVSGQASL